MAVEAGEYTKGIGEINSRIRELITEGQEEHVYELLREELLMYYSTPEGRAEIDRSPNKHMRTEEAVDTLMQGVPTRLERIRKEGK